MSQPEEEDKVSSRVVYEHAFKLLAPEPLSSAIIGGRGSGIQEIERVTQTKISLASRAEKYPGTFSRIVLIRGHSRHAIDAVIGSIIAKLKQLVDAPRNDGVDYSEIITRNGEFKLKCVLPRDVVGGLIGKKGANISELVERTGCKVRIEDGKVGSGDTAEQKASLVGSVENLVGCLVSINDAVQATSSASWFQEWARLKGREGIPTGGDYYSKGFSGKGDGKGKGKGKVTESEEELVYRVLHSMPAHLTTYRTFALQTSLPIDSMSALIGKGGNYTREIASVTGAKVSLRNEDPNTTITVEGSLHGVLAGYALVMKKHLELEAVTLGRKKGGYVG